MKKNVLKLMFWDKGLVVLPVIMALLGLLSCGGIIDSVVAKAMQTDKIEDLMTGKIKVKDSSFKKRVKANSRKFKLHAFVDGKIKWKDYKMKKYVTCSYKNKKYAQNKVIVDMSTAFKKKKHSYTTNEIPLYIRKTRRSRYILSPIIGTDLIEEEISSITIYISVFNFRLDTEKVLIYNILKSTFEERGIVITTSASSPYSIKEIKFNKDLLISSGKYKLLKIKKGSFLKFD